MTVEIQDFKLVAGNVYHLRGWPDERKVAIIYHIGNDWEGKPRAFGITRMVKPDGVEECEDNSWDLDGSFGDIHGKSRLDIVAEIGSYFPAWNTSQAALALCGELVEELMYVRTQVNAWATNIALHERFPKVEAMYELNKHIEGTCREATVQGVV